jgi:thiol-disulfide isomerase/thioredoxin
VDTTGLIVVATVLVLGVLAGWWRRRTDGRLASVAGPASAGGWASDADEAGVVGQPEREVVDPSAAGQRIDPALLAALGVEPAPATLLQFSSAFCAPCRAVRRVSGEVADLLPGVRHVEVDAESHLEAVRALGIWRTPTLLVLDADGRVAKRATGVPGKAQLIAALGDLLPAARPGADPAPTPDLRICTCAAVMGLTTTKALPRATLTGCSLIRVGPGSPRR